MIMLGMADWIVIALVLLSVWAGVTQGAIKEFMGLSSWLVAAFVALSTYSYVVGWIASFGYYHQYLSVAVLLCIFVLVILLSRWLSKLLISLLDMVNLVWLDQVLGAVFGLVRGLAIMLISAYAIHELKFNSVYLADSTFIPKFYEWDERILGYLDGQSYWQHRYEYKDSVDGWTQDHMPE